MKQILILLLFLFGKELISQDIDIKLIEVARLQAFKLGKNVSIIANKAIDRQRRMEVLNETMDMFQNINCKIEVSSKYNDSIKDYKIRDYLNHLMDIRQYKEVELEWNYVDVISELLQKDDGQFYVTLIVFQKFSGRGIDGKELYKDITKKSIEVQIGISSEDIKTNNIEKGSKCRFGNMKVIETNNPDQNTSRIIESDPKS